MPGDPAPFEFPTKPVSIEEVHRLLPVIRQSTLAKMDECSLTTLFDLRHGWGWSSHPAAAGTLFHRFAAEMMKTLIEQKERKMPVAEALEILYEIAAQKDVPPWDRVRVPMRHWGKLRMGVIKFAKDNEFSIDRITAIEERLYADVPYQMPDGRMTTRRFTGQPDLLIYAEDRGQGPGAIVLDYKLSWQVPPRRRDPEPPEFPDDERRLSYEGYFQQRAYGYLVLMNFPSLQWVTLREFYPLRTMAREATVYRSDVEHIERELSLLMQELDRAIAAGPRYAGTGHPRDPWRPTPGKMCQWCAKPGACPIEAEARGEGAVTDEATAARYAAEFQVAGGVKEHRRGGLKNWCNVNGAVLLRGGKGRRAIGFVETPTGGMRFEIFTVEESDRGADDPSLTAALDESLREAEMERARTRRTRRGRAKVA